MGRRRRHGLARALASVVLAVAAIAGVWSPSACSPVPNAPRVRSGTRRVVILVPHGDDEALFAGEVLAAYASRTDLRVTVVLTTDCGGPRAYVASHPEYPAARFNFARGQLEALGLRDVRTLGVRVGTGSTLASKTAEMTSRLRATGLVDARVELWTISGTGNIDHEATYASSIALAREVGLRELHVFWGYVPKGQIVATPDVGSPVGGFATDAHLVVKDSLIAGYERFFAMRYPQRQEPLLPLETGRHDLITAVEVQQPPR
jgi:LmbE family N-acetylglucosaminyl deacetylase